MIRYTRIQDKRKSIDTTGILFTILIPGLKIISNTEIRVIINKIAQTGFNGCWITHKSECGKRIEEEIRRINTPYNIRIELI
ncbi:hypothetical protein CHISP_0075 [Chitinispirillum alkaliphilum]|nr:hypothetical protein CHISP_0075 [Chitinispirillum alkaliphilum]